MENFSTYKKLYRHCLAFSTFIYYNLKFFSYSKLDFSTKYGFHKRKKAAAKFFLRQPFLYDCNVLNIRL